MPLFYLKFKIVEGYRRDCMTLFGGMKDADDRADMGDGIELLGRWSTLGEGAGFCVCKAENARVLGNWLANWIPMVTITVVPVVDDNQAREIILGKKPEYIVTYDKTGAQAKDGESLYFIEYSFKEGCKSTGFDLFASLDAEKDTADAGLNTPYGRWHDLATGTGIAICSSASEFDLQSWAYHWKEICDCRITPVLSDSDFRNIIQSKPWFGEHQAALQKKTSGTRRWFF